MQSMDPRWQYVMPCNDPQAPPCTLWDGLVRAGNRSFDMEALARSEYGQKYLDGLAPAFLSRDPMDARILSYWEEKGLRKERVLGGPQDWNQWYIFTPTSASKPQNADRKYPLIIGLHGGGAGPRDGEPILMAESSCYARKAAEEELILAMPEDHDAEPIHRLYEYMLAHYPVDPSRVYLAGFSAGGDRSCRAALRYPELFAGICVGAGVPFNLYRDEADIARAARYKIPLIAVGCLQDKGNHTPFWRDSPMDNPVPDFIAKILCAEGKMGWINTFLTINHTEHRSLEETIAYLRDHGTEEEKRLGLCAHRSWSYEWAGARHYCLAFTDREGVESTRYAFVDGLPHTEPVDMMDIAWPFLSRFSRDPRTGELRVE